MKQLLLSTLLLASTIFANSSIGTSITTKVTDVKSSEGKIRLAIYSSTEAYSSKDYYKRESVDAQEGSVEITLDVEPGKYVIMVLHDRNSNKKMDKNMMGIPKEPYGASNNVYKSFGRPDYTLSEFEVKEGESVMKEVKLLDK